EAWILPAARMPGRGPVSRHERRVVLGRVDPARAAPGDDRRADGDAVVERAQLLEALAPLDLARLELREGREEARHERVDTDVAVPARAFEGVARRGIREIRRNQRPREVEALALGAEDDLDDLREHGLGGIVERLDERAHERRGAHARLVEHEVDQAVDVRRLELGLVALDVDDQVGALALALELLPRL